MTELEKQESKALLEVLTIVNGLEFGKHFEKERLEKCLVEIEILNHTYSEMTISRIKALEASGKNPTAEALFQVLSGTMVIRGCRSMEHKLKQLIGVEHGAGENQKNN